MVCSVSCPLLLRMAGTLGSVAGAEHTAFTISMTNNAWIGARDDAMQQVRCSCHRCRDVCLYVALLYVPGAWPAPMGSGASHKRWSGSSPQPACPGK
jgi:hypothetical protein